jgi:hypothetical protein
MRMGRRLGLSHPPAGKRKYLVGRPHHLRWVMLKDELRALIRAKKPAILEELAAEAAERRKAIKSACDAATPDMQDSRAALVLGHLQLCGNCTRFVFGTDPGGLGHCRRFNLEAAPFVPFWCAGFEASRTPAAPDYLPDPDGARAGAKEYLK